MTGTKENSAKRQQLSGRLQLDQAGLPFLGETRVALLEAIASQGSISKAAKQVGWSYKTAWEAVEAMNNLSPEVLVERSVGGRDGGGTRITPSAERLIRLYRGVESKYLRFLEDLRLDQGEGDDGCDWEAVFQQLRRWSMKTSARNQLLGTVSKVTPGAVNAEVLLTLEGGTSLVAVITNDSVNTLGLAVGKAATALVKASSILLLTDAGVRTSARNALNGTVARVVPGAVNAEVVVALSGGKTLTAIVTQESVANLELHEGKPVTALIKASSIILAIVD